MPRGDGPSRGSSRNVSMLSRSWDPNVGRYPTFVTERHLRSPERSQVRVIYTPTAGSTSAVVLRFSVGTVFFAPTPWPCTMSPSILYGRSSIRQPPKTPPPLTPVPISLLQIPAPPHVTAP